MNEWYQGCPHLPNVSGAKGLVSCREAVRACCSCPLLHSCASTHIRPIVLPYGGLCTAGSRRRRLSCPRWALRAASRGAGPGHRRRPVHAGSSSVIPLQRPACGFPFAARALCQIFCDVKPLRTPSAVLSPACCATRRSSLAAPECGLLLLLLPVDFNYDALCRFAWPSSSLPAPPPRRRPGKGEGYTELESRGCRG